MRWAVWGHRLAPGRPCPRLPPAESEQNETTSRAGGGQAFLVPSASPSPRLSKAKPSPCRQLGRPAVLLCPAALTHLFPALIMALLGCLHLRCAPPTWGPPCRPSLASLPQALQPSHVGPWAQTHEPEDSRCRSPQARHSAVAHLPGAILAQPPGGSAPPRGGLSNLPQVPSLLSGWSRLRTQPLRLQAWALPRLNGLRL